MLVRCVKEYHPRLLFLLRASQTPDKRNALLIKPGGCTTPQQRTPTNPEPHLLLGEPRINDEHDTVDRERGLGDIGGDDHLPANGPVRLVGRRPLEDPLLEVGRECGVERDALEFAHVGPERVYFALDPLARLLDLLLPRQEEQQVPGDLFANVDLERAAITKRADRHRGPC